jgi:hypothetical protein
LLIPFHHPRLTTRNSIFETPGEKPGGFRAARVVGAALEPPGFSPGVSKWSYGWLNVGDKKEILIGLFSAVMLLLFYRIYISQEHRIQKWPWGNFAKNHPICSKSETVINVNANSVTAKFSYVSITETDLKNWMIIDNFHPKTLWKTSFLNQIFNRVFPVTLLIFTTNHSFWFEANWVIFDGVFAGTVFRRNVTSFVYNKSFKEHHVQKWPWGNFAKNHPICPKSERVMNVNTNSVTAKFSNVSITETDLKNWMIIVNFQPEMSVWKTSFLDQIFNRLCSNTADIHNKSFLLIWCKLGDFWWSFGRTVFSRNVTYVV